MTTYESALTIDFGEVGFWNGKQPFRVRLETGPLADLIRATENAHRVYELLLLDRKHSVNPYADFVGRGFRRRGRLGSCASVGTARCP